METKTYIFIYFYQQYLVLFTILHRNREGERERTNAKIIDGVTKIKTNKWCLREYIFQADKVICEHRALALLSVRA